MNAVLVSTAYLPPINYLSKLIEADQVVIEKHEYFVKQTYRNRCEILTANGKLNLSIPLVKQSHKEIISEKMISYAENWQKQHWRAIISAYKNSPYFEYFEEELLPFYDTQHEFLFDYNTKLLNAVLNILRIKKSIGFTNQFEETPIGITDLRKLSEIANPDVSVMKPYYQVFADKAGFTPNLSCLDALFNVGLETRELTD